MTLLLSRFPKIDVLILPLSCLSSKELYEIFVVGSNDYYLVTPPNRDKFAAKSDLRALDGDVKLPWVEYFDSKTQRPYYVHSETGESTWNRLVAIFYEALTSLLPLTGSVQVSDHDICCFSLP